MRERERAQFRAFAVAIESLARERLRHHAIDRPAAVHEPDQRAPGRQAGDEAFGPVDRIEHPDVFRVGAIAPVFLSDHAVGGKGLRDEPPHGRLGAPVGLRDGIEAPAARFVFCSDRAPEKRENHLARNLRELLDEGGKVDGGHGKIPKKCEKSHAQCAYLLSRHVVA